MSRLLPQLRISPPTGPLPPGRGFYQLEESALYVPIGISDPSPFFSYLESDTVRFDINQKGQLLFIEIDAGRHTWKVDRTFEGPAGSESADVRWLDFRSTISSPQLLSNRPRTMLHLKFTDASVARSVQIAEHVVLQITEDTRLAGLTVLDICDDLAGQEIAKFRASLRKEISSRL